VTERAVLKLTREGIVVTEIAPGVELQSNILDQSEFPLIISPKLKLMDAKLFGAAITGLKLHD
jgi:propionate CoA-transferase